MSYGGNVNILVSFYILTLVIFSRQVYEPLEEFIDCSLMFCFFVNVGGHISISHWISRFWSRRPLDPLWEHRIWGVFIVHHEA